MRYPGRHGGQIVGELPFLGNPLIWKAGCGVIRNRPQMDRVLSTLSVDEHRGGFTLVELLVVIAIIGVLVALLLPAVQAARESARRSQCSNNLRQIAIALQNYHSSHNVLPYGSPECCTPNGGNWLTMLFPYIEEQTLSDQFDWNGNVREIKHAKLVQQVVPVYICPSSPRAGTPVFDDRVEVHNPNPAFGTWYTGCMGPTQPDQCPLCPPDLQTPSPTNWCCQGNNFGTNAGNGYPEGNGVGMFSRHRVPRVSFKDVVDGLSKTLMVGETLPEQCAYISTFAMNFNVSTTAIPLNTHATDQNPISEKSDKNGRDWWLTSGFKSEHPGGAHIALGDASVRFFPEQIDHKTYSNLGTRAGEEPVSVE